MTYAEQNIKTRPAFDEDDEEELRLLREDIEQGASTVIQAAWRGKAVRKRDLLPRRQSVQVLVVPSEPGSESTRRSLEMTQYDTTSSDEDFEHTHDWEEDRAAAIRALAATDLQAAYRGHLTRVRMKSKSEPKGTNVAHRHRLTSRDRVDSLQLNRMHLEPLQKSGPESDSPSTAFRPPSSPRNPLLGEWDGLSGDERLTNNEQIEARHPARASQAPDYSDPQDMVARLAAAALNDDDDGTESDDSLLYEPPTGPPHIPASDLNKHHSPIQDWEQMASKRERNVTLKFDVDELEQVRMISPRENTGYELDDSSLLSTSYDDGLGLDSLEPYEHRGASSDIEQASQSGLTDANLTTKGSLTLSRPGIGRTGAPSTPPPRDSSSMLAHGAGPIQLVSRADNEAATRKLVERPPSLPAQVPDLPPGENYNPDSRWEILYTGPNRTGERYYVQQPLPDDDTDELVTQWETPSEGVRGFGDFDEDSEDETA